MLTWLISIFTNKQAITALQFTENVIVLFEGYELKDQNYKNATIDTFIALLNEHKTYIG